MTSEERRSLKEALWKAKVAKGKYLTKTEMMQVINGVQEMNKCQSIVKDLVGNMVSLGGKR